ncbi:ATP synthase F1 subunit epsilon [Myxococcota bacterium]
MSSDPTITLEIVTPDGTGLTERVRSLTAPSVEGEFGVMPGHRALLAALKTGIVTYDKDGDERRVGVGSGFVEVFEDRAVLLTERFIRREDVDPVAARLELKEADEQLDQYGDDPTGSDFAGLVSRQLWAAVQLELHGDPPPAIIRTVAEFQARPIEDYTQLPSETESTEASNPREPSVRSE